MLHLRVQPSTNAGREFGTQSIAIHEPKCIAKWDQAQAALPKSQRRPRPQKPQPITPGNPSAVGAGTQSPADLEAYNAAARDAYLDQGRVECENCGRKFAQDRLEVHLRSCRPGGFFARKMEQRAQTAVAEPKSEPNFPTTSAITSKPVPAKLIAAEAPRQLNPLKKAPLSSPRGSIKSLNMVPTASDALQLTKATQLRPLSGNKSVVGSGRKGVSDLGAVEMSVTGTVAKTSSRPSTVSRRNPVQMGMGRKEEVAVVSGAADKFCAECGAKNGGEWKFCSECGVKRVVSQKVDVEY
ncbi:hypothetical protein BC830DRAFT_829786 [Chytriomyces sp. MP71]|nr:hypothetical protein BC830DRAFT_829786 [Chytriomyces sp. MP71]